MSNKTEFCNKCNEPCKIGEEKCKLKVPLFYAAAVNNPAGLVNAMWEAGFKFDERTDKFIVR